MSSSGYGNKVRMEMEKNNGGINVTSKEVHTKINPMNDKVPTTSSLQGGKVDTTSAKGTIITTLQSN